MFQKVWFSSKNDSHDDTFERASLGRRLLGLVFGYDFFISYSWSDGGSYAAALTRQLRSHGFEVFLDRDDYASGDDWKKVGAWKLWRTGQLVLIGSPAALTSAPVVREVKIFSSTGRRIVPIDFDGTLEWKANDAPLAQYLPPEILRIREPVAALQTGPSDQVAVVIRRTFNLVRQDKKRVQWLASIAALLGVLAVVAGWQSVQATRARNIAEEQRDQAQRVLAQITASAGARVMAFAEHAMAEASAQEEIANITRSGGESVPGLARSLELIKLSNEYYDHRDFAAALRAGQTALTLLDTASDASSVGPEYRLTKANAYERTGLAKWQLGRFDESAKDLAAGLAIIQQLTSEAPQDTILLERMAAAHVNLGEVSIDTQEFDDAELHFKLVIGIRSTVPNLRTLTEPRRLLAAAHRRMANLQEKRQQYTAALESSSLSISMLEQLHTEKPDNNVLGDLSAAYDIHARVLESVNKQNLAMTWREKDLAIVKQLAEIDPDNIEKQHNLALSLAARGRLLEKFTQDDAALQAYAEAINVTEALLKASSRISPEWLRDAADPFGRRGDILKRRGHTAEAVSDYRRRLEILERLASSSPDIISPDILQDAYRRTRAAFLELNRWAEAFVTAEQQLFAISLGLNRESRDLNRVADVLSSLCWTAILAGNTSRAEVTGRQALALAPGHQNARANYAHALMYSGNLEQAKKIYLDGLSAGEEQAVKWQKMIHADFVYLSARNLQHPLMAEIERRIAQ